MQKETKGAVFFWEAEFSYFSTEKLGIFGEFFFSWCKFNLFLLFIMKKIPKLQHEKNEKTLQRRDMCTKA
jgi:hypothetical protein